MLKTCRYSRFRAALTVAAVLTLCKVGPSRADAQVTLPIEVMGTSPTSVSVSVNVPQSTSPVAAVQLEVDGIEYTDQASIKINNQSLVAINNTNFKSDPTTASWGGIGGPLANMTLTMNLPSGWVTSGATTVTFGYNGPEGSSSGYRVLGFNFIYANGTLALPKTAFTQANPATWKPPFGDAKNIAAGQTLWHSATLQISPGGPSIKAHCADCHAVDGHDLRYFCYSNYSIEVRSQFHGLTLTQGEQIASYIRKLPGPAPGRPWNPPYQPGPGIDHFQATYWAAGGGYEDVLPNDAAMLPYLFPKGITQTSLPTTGYLNIRQTPIALPLPTWNQWLPTIHPMDFWGSVFTNSTFSSTYQTITQTLATNQQNGTLITYLSDRFSQDLFNWTGNAMRNFNLANVKPIKTWTPSISEAVYSDGKWHMVKVWELMQQYQLEDQGDLFFGDTPLTEPRTWNSNSAFVTSPKAQGVPEKDGTSVGGKALTQHYYADAWYQLQLILNSGNGHQDATTPIDWSYNYGIIDHTALMSLEGTALRFTSYLVKAMEVSTNGNPPDGMEHGWAPAGMDAIYLLEHDQTMWNQLPASTQGKILTALLNAWLNETASFQPSQYWGVMTDEQQTPVLKGDPVFGTQARWVDEVAWMIINFRAKGANNALCNSVCDWAQTVWPNWNWSQLKK